MAKIIFEFGTENIEGLRDAIELAVENSEYQVSVTSAAEKESLEYTYTQDTLRSAIERIERGSITSFLLFPKSSPIGFVIICVPNFVGDPMPLWWGSIDYEGLEWEMMFNHLLEVEELQFLTVSVEEGLDLEGKDLNANTFPWDHWRLIVGAVRNRSSTTNDWVIKKGPAYTQVSGNVIR
jgi:hypothetical protein